MRKIFFAAALGIALYLSLSYYQPVVEAQTLASTSEDYQLFSFISPIPYDLVVQR